MHPKTAHTLIGLLPALLAACCGPGLRAADPAPMSVPPSPTAPAEAAPGDILFPPPPDAPAPTLTLPPIAPPSRLPPPAPRKTAARPKPRSRRIAQAPPPRPPLRVTERAFVFGHSVQGAPLRAWVLDNGDGAASDVTLILGGFHGDERGTPGVVMRLKSFLRAHPNDWRGRRAVLVPCANPDGWAAGTRPNARGVDLNRNFPAAWAPQGRAARYSPGPAPTSEPETRALIALLAHVRPAKIVSLHSPLRCLNPTGPQGLAMARAMHALNGLPIKLDIGYPTPGSLGNYCGSRGIGIVTLELPPGTPSAGGPGDRWALLAAIRLPARTTLGVKSPEGASATAGRAPRLSAVSRRSSRKGAS